MHNLETETFSQIYSGVLLNRQQMFSTHNKENKKIHFLLQSIIYFIFIFIKIMLSKFLKQSYFNKKIIGLNFSVYKYRFKELSPELTVIDYLYKKINKSQVRLHNYISLTAVIKLVYTKNSNDKKHYIKFENNNFFYRFVCAAEYNLLDNLISQNNFTEVITAGLNDRYCIFLSAICKKRNINLSIIQHGALTKFDGCYRIEADNFYYMYDFSKSYLKYFFKNTDTINFLPCEREFKHQELGNIDNEVNIAFACTPSNIELNFQIIDILLQDLAPTVKVYIHPHPRENNKTYEKKYAHIKNVCITKKKFINIKFLVTRISSLGVELKKTGIEPVFINLEGHETDYLATGEYLAFEKIPEFKIWLNNNSPIANMYHTGS
ncbi:hypothetical protein ABN070_17280 [Morganella morganii]|uniref:hypothetical protein n=1 Tax=Morganella morganii TaxID=582 RepID=UPI0032DA8089